MQEDNPTMSLDNRFGPVCKPHCSGGGAAIEDHEYSNQPQSLCKLSTQSAEYLKWIMKITKHKWKAGKILLSNVSILWIIDSGGHLWFSIEELFDEQPHQHWEVNSPRPRWLFKTIQEIKALKKLGHPSLISGKDKQARIGGDIYFESRGGKSSWLITNKSGRYGFGKAREEKHLQEVVNLFKEFKIELELDYLPPHN